MPADQINILAVDDEPKLLDAVCSYLADKGYRLFAAASGRQALDIFARENISLAILDLMLPDMPGEAVCRAVRAQSRAPIIMLTAKVGEDDMLRGLRIGADDYITKPFSLKLLHARVEAVLRRAEGDLVPLSVKNSYRGGDLSVDFEKNVFLKRQERVSLTANEIKLLAALAKRPGKVFTRAELIESALGDDFDGYDRTIDAHVKNLRRKIEDNPGSPDYILTVHGIGYKFGGV
ncbi:MAG: response regulator transcription factor [Clostridiales bacterium]|jgi:DNA-binding response OmpR family regulator|nr:response regulator transcription factor [Clostridiales bacterium]